MLVLVKKLKQITVLTEYVYEKIFNFVTFQILTATSMYIQMTIFCYV
jgi:hypothetical protein